MKALTIRQPYATLIALGVKTIETRSWRAPQALIGQTIAIHAGKHRPKDVWCSASADPVFPPPLARLYDYGKCVDPQESNDGEWWRYRWDGPLGAIVATATLADCVPMVDYAEEAWRPNPWNGKHRLWPNVRPGELWRTNPDGGPALDVSDQLPYGDFQPGRWAWLLTDVKPTTERCPACMGEGQFYEDSMAVVGVPGGRYPVAPCTTCGTPQEAGCGTCPPIPAKGRQGLWEWQP